MTGGNWQVKWVLFFGVDKETEEKKRNNTL